MDVDWQIVETEKEIYLLFQESTSSIDWKVNFNFPVKPYKNQESVLYVHRGFAEAYKSCNDEIMKAFLNKVFHGEKTKLAIIAGWSYGGAMAQLASEDFFYRTDCKAKVITFGAPKIAGGIGTRNYLKNCALSVEQYAHRSDIVPKVPPMFFKYGRVSLGKFSLPGLFRPNIYHCDYGNKELY